MRKTLALLTLAALPVATLHANPTGARVTHGNASFEIDGKNLIIRQGSDKAVIHWDDFSISLDELTRFIQPSSDAAALNRVTGALPSTIDGALQANGKLVLINPNGILVGPHGRIDTQSFIGSTLGLTDDDFLAGGDLTFSGDSQATVVNLGTINAVGGDIFLFGRSVENHGSLNAPDGTVGVGAGQQVLLKQSGDERVFVQPKGSGKSATGVDNSGTIAAAAAELKAHGNLYALAVNNTGIVRATGATKKNGRVLLTAPGGKVRNSGTITARNADRTGGTVRVTGSDVTLTSTSKIDASGESAGGTVNIGGGYQGKDPSISNATTTTVGSGATITADAASGNAGDIVVWANGTTTFAGTISARALGTVGNGGNAEVSGAENLHYTGSADLRGTNGHYGDLLLDPGTIIVGGPLILDPGYFAVADLAAQLVLANVTLSTSVTPGGIDPEHIIRFEPGTNLTWNTPTDLRLDSQKTIVIAAGASITNTSTGNIQIEAVEQGPTSGSYNGVEIHGALSTTGGEIIIRGESGPDGGIGVLINAPVTAGTTASGNSSIDINGSARGGPLSPGVRLAPGASLTTNHGNISVRGNGGTGTTGQGQSPGIQLDPNASITSTGTGPDETTIFLDGNGGRSPAAADNDGIALFGNASITSADADIILRGTGPSSTASNSGGIFIESATIQSTGTGNIELKGIATATGTDNNGIRLGHDFPDLPGFVPPTIATNSGDLTIDGQSTTSTGIHIQAPSSVRTQTGNVTLTGNGSGPNNQILAPNGIDILQTDGTFTFDGRIDTPSLTTSPGAYAIDFPHGANIGSGVTFNNTGGLSINSSNIPGTAFNVLGPITATTRHLHDDGFDIPVSLSGAIQTPGASITFTDIGMTGDTLISTTLPGAPIEPEPQIEIRIVSFNNPHAFVVDGSPTTDITIMELLPPGRVNILGGRNATLTSSGGFELGPINISDHLFLATAGPITQNGPISAHSLQADSAGNELTLDHPGNSFSDIHFLGSGASITLYNSNPAPLVINGGASAGENIEIFTRGGGLTIGPAAQVQAGNNLTLATDGNFINLSQNPVQSGGRTLVYTASVDGAQLGTFTPDTTELGKSFPEPPTATTGNALLAVTDEIVIPPDPIDPVTPGVPDIVTRPRAGNTGPGNTPPPVTTTGGPPPRVAAILDRIRRDAPRGSNRPERDNPVNHIAGHPRLLVAQLDSSGSSDPHPPRATPRPFPGSPFAGALFAAPDSDLFLTPGLGPVTFGTGGTFGTSDASLPKDLLEGLGDQAVGELEDALQQP